MTNLGFQIRILTQAQPRRTMVPTPLILSGKTVAAVIGHFLSHDSPLKKLINPGTENDRRGKCYELR